MTSTPPQPDEHVEPTHDAGPGAQTHPITTQASVAPAISIEEPGVMTEPPADSVASPVAAVRQEMTFVPLAVTIGDGFKFGCGFFLAFVVAMLIGTVLFAALFVLTSAFGMSVPLSR